jgi:hypothetical protein
VLVQEEVGIEGGRRAEIVASVCETGPRVDVVVFERAERSSGEIDVSA